MIGKRTTGTERTAGGDPGTETTGAESPLVTVVVTTYNRPSYLVDAVESVRQQSYDPIELVVVDDSSDRRASSVLDTPLEGFHEVQYVRHDENRGANAARNTGIRHASGKYIAFLDDDDRWVPTKVARQVAVLEEHDDAGLVYTGVRSVYEDDTQIYIPSEVDGNLTKHLLCRNVIGTLSAVMVRAGIARETPLDEGFPSWADLEWYVRLSQKTEFHRIPRALVVYDFASHNRLSDDFEKKRVAYERFLTEFDDVASQYGEPFRRKMRAWAAFRLGSTALTVNRYDEARTLFLRAFWTYPLEPRFLVYLLALLGGRYTYDAARSVRRAVAPVLNML